MKLKFASLAGCGIGNNSDLPLVKLVAYLDKAVVLIAALTHVILVVAGGVDEG